MLKMSRVLGRLQEISSVKAGWLGGRLRYQRYRGRSRLSDSPFLAITYALTHAKNSSPWSYSDCHHTVDADDARCRGMLRRGRAGGAA